MDMKLIDNDIIHENLFQKWRNILTWANFPR